MPAPPAPELVDLALLALQLRGGRAKSTDEVIKPLKRGVTQAISNGWIDQSREREDHPTLKDKKGLPKRITVTWWQLTSDGRTRLTSLPDPELRAMSVTSLLQHLRQDINQAAEAFRISVERQVAGGFHDLLEIVDDTRRRIGDLDPVASAPADGLADQPLRDLLASTYRALTYEIKFEHGLVDIPTLFERARESQPDLVAAQVVAEVERLWRAGELKLRVANEIYHLTEAQRAMGIWHDAALHYFVLWPEAR